MNTATTTPRPVPVRIDAPNAKDECDRCMQPALWRVMFATGKELLFCGHHAQKYGFTSSLFFRLRECTIRPSGNLKPKANTITALKLE